MAAIPYSVAEAFKRQQPARAGAFVSVGDGIYSYGLKLAHWEDGAIVRDFSGKAPSVTTARHMRALDAVIG